MSYCPEVLFWVTAKDGPNFTFVLALCYVLVGGDGLVRSLDLNPAFN